MVDPSITLTVVLILLVSIIFPDLPTSNILGLAVAGGKTNLDPVSARTPFLPTFPCRLRYMHAAALRIDQSHRKATTARGPQAHSPWPMLAKSSVQGSLRWGNFQGGVGLWWLALAGDAVHPCFSERDQALAHASQPGLR